MAKLIYANLLVGLANSSVDNFNQGGVFIKVNLADGTLGKGIYNKKERSEFITEHPDSGFKFSGINIPYWKEIKYLILKAAKYTPFCRSVGWDIGITAEAPILIEGNDNHSLELQALFGGYLQPNVRAILKEYDLYYPEKILPRFSLGNMIQSIRLWSS